MFTCTYGGAQKKTIKLNRTGAMAPLQPDEYMQVLVVRGGDAAAVDAYVRHWGSTYLIAVMPASMRVKYGGSPEMELHAEVGRIGYARLFCQLLAHEIGLEEIWMLDDNVQRCWTIETNTETSLPGTSDGLVQLKQCGFSNVMRGMELLLDNGHLDHHETSLPCGTEAAEERVVFDATKENKKTPARLAHDGEASQLIVGSQAKSTSQPLANLSQYSGAKQAFGILGMQRDDPRNRLRQKEGFTTTHSVYSFFLLNVKATLDAGVLYPSKAIWEDIEFLHMVSEADLAVCKFNRYIHQKHHLRLQIPPPPTYVPELVDVLRSLKYAASPFPSVYIEDEEHAWFDEAMKAMLNEHADPHPGDAVIALQIPENGQEVHRIYKELKSHAKRAVKNGTQFERFVLLVQRKDVPSGPGAEPPLHIINASEDALLHKMSGLSKPWVEEHNGSIGHDGHLVVRHGDDEYFVISLPVGPETQPVPKPGSKRTLSSEERAATSGTTPAAKVGKLNFGEEDATLMDVSAATSSRKLSDFVNISNVIQVKLDDQITPMEWAVLEAAKNARATDASPPSSAHGWTFKLDKNRRISMVHDKSCPAANKLVPSESFFSGTVQSRLAILKKLGLVKDKPKPQKAAPNNAAVFEG